MQRSTYVLVAHHSSTVRPMRRRPNAIILRLELKQTVDANPFPSTARFIKFRQHNEAAKALEELSGAEVLGRAMRLSKAAAR